MLLNYSAVSLFVFFQLYFFTPLLDVFRPYHCEDIANLNDDRLTAKQFQDRHLDPNEAYLTEVESEGQRK
jgi:hypothetical protein